jgi:hypothetical protein
MKKLAIIGTAVAAFAGPLAQSAWAMPADVTPLVQSQSVAPLPAVTLEQGSSQRFAAQPTFGPTKAEQRADTLRGEALNRKYGLGIDSLTLERGTNDRFAADNPTRGDVVRSTPTTTSSPDFQWGDAGIGAGALLGIVALLGAGLFEVRHHGRLGTS